MLIESSEGPMVSVPLADACSSVAEQWSQFPDTPVNDIYDTVYLSLTREAELPAVAPEGLPRVELNQDALDLDEPASEGRF